MRIRTDFVSNSSSSSFIVKAEKTTPELFRSGEKYGFDKYIEQNLYRDVTECFRDVTWRWSSWRYNNDEDFDIRKIVNIIPDSEFVKKYLDHGVGKFTLPESCRKYIDEICCLVENICEIDSEERPDLFENGEISKKMSDEWDQAKWKRLQNEEYKRDVVLKKACLDIAELLRPEMGKWEFYYRELEDEEETEGGDALNDVSWYRIFNNH